MRILKIKLNDKAVYQFATLTITETSAIRKFRNLMAKDQKELNDLETKAGGQELSDVEMNRLDELQDKQVDNMFKIILVGISKNHAEFKVTETNTEDQSIDKLKALVDIRDLRRIATFVMVGSLPPEPELEINNDAVIDLSGE